MHNSILTTSFLSLLISLNFADDTLIQTPLGPVRGLLQSDAETGKNFYEFRGMRYAKAPTGERRFRKPEPVDPWTEEYDATKFGYACPQITSPLNDDGSDNQSEDCLFLNVYVPETATKGDKLSVMVWIHGGGFMMGNGFFYDGTRLTVDGNVIVVTINYRLGLLGFLGLHHSASRGNYGLWDQIAALQWVQNNIASFRGDPGSVTIFGQSGGSWSVSYLTLIPSNKGLFQRAIAQSGVVSRFTLPGRKALAKIIPHVSEKTSCPADDMNVFVDCLKKADVELLLNASDPMINFPEDKYFLEILYGPMVDGDLFPDHPMRLLEDTSSPQSQFFGSLDFVAGTTSQEGSLLYMSIMPALQELYNFNISIGIPSSFVCDAMVKPYVEYFYNADLDVQTAMCKFYTSDVSEDDQSNRAVDFNGDILMNPWTAQMLDYHSRLNKGRTYQYQVSKPSPYTLGYPYVLPPTWYKGAGHGDELINLFRSDSRNAYFNNTLSDEEKRFSRVMISYWTSFAKTGVPCGGHASLPWMEYDPKRRIYIDFDLNVSLRQNWRLSTTRFWTEELPPMPIDEDLKISHDEL